MDSSGHLQLFSAAIAPSAVSSAARVAPTAQTLPQELDRMQKVLTKTPESTSSAEQSLQPPEFFS